jgi:hypothetical protein
LHQSVPVIYLAALHDPVIAFGNTTPLQLIDHLHGQYGWITEAELDNNTEQMKQRQWQPPTVIEVLFLQIENGIAFALAGDDPKSEPVILPMHGLQQHRQDRVIRHGIQIMVQGRTGSQDMGLFQDGIQGGRQGLAPHGNYRIRGIPRSHTHISSRQGP